MVGWLAFDHFTLTLPCNCLFESSLADVALILRTCAIINFVFLFFCFNNLKARFNISPILY